MIQPNPLATGRYVVLNSGHTFREKELASLNIEGLELPESVSGDRLANR